MKIVVRWLLLAAALLLVAQLGVGVTVAGFGSAMIAAFVIGLFNTLLRPILVLLTRTRLAVLSSLFALVIPTVVIALAGADSVARVGDAGDIPRGIPLPHLPDFRLFSFSLVTGALAVAAIVLVQGAGVAEAAPNPGDARPNPDQDIIAQGAGNLASGLFRGIPVGGSVGQTALGVSVGAKTRWAAIWSGVWLLVILALFSGLVARIAMPTLAAILIFAAIGSLQLGEVRSIMRTGRGSQIAVITTAKAMLARK